jgi:hypothetical protein
MKLDSLNKPDLEALAASNDVEVEDGDTKADIISKLEAQGVTEAPDGGGNDDDASEGFVGASEETNNPGKGGTPGGATDSPQPQDSPAEVPTLPEEVAVHVDPRSAMPVLPDSLYDDSLRG